jgi:hypothetical protein
MSKLAKFRRRHGEPKRNPPLSTDVVAQILPGFVAFAATRFVTRTAALQIAKRWPKYAKHAGAMASIGTFATAWLGAHRVKTLEKYHDMIVIGSGIAAIQSLVQLYLPAFGWVVSDCSPQLGAAPAQKLLAAQTAAQQQQQQLSGAGRPARIPQGFKPTTANEWFTYNDAYDAGGYRGKTEAAQPSVPGETAAEEPDVQISDLLDNSDLQLDNSDLGLS